MTLRPASSNTRYIKATTSLCPECLMAIDAVVSERHGEVWMDKTCPDHGRFEALLSSDVRGYFEAPIQVGAPGNCCGGNTKSAD